MSYLSGSDLRYRASETKAKKNVMWRFQELVNMTDKSPKN